MTPNNANAAAIERDGFAVIDNLINQERVEQLRAELARLVDKQSAASHGMRHLFDQSQVIRDSASDSVIRERVIPLLGPHCFAVRATFFDKIPEANWKVPWHQDAAIEVTRRVKTEGFEAWSCKDGIDQVRPPIEVMTGILALRLHLDDCGEDNGPLRLLIGSHTRAWHPSEIDGCRQTFSETTCEVPAGGALVMRPLLLHASSPARVPKHRRVIHLEYTARELPGKLDWRYRIA